MNTLELFWQTTQISRSQIISPEKDDLLFDSDANILWPGFLGDNYNEHRILFIGHFPAGGTKSYPESTDYKNDRPFYSAMSDFKLCTIVDRKKTFIQLNDITREYIKTWSIYKLIEKTLTATELLIDDIAYINAVPFRMPNNRKPSTLEIEKSWHLYTESIIKKLSPQLLVCLGKATGYIINRYYNKTNDVFIFERRIGDRSIHPSVEKECDKIAFKIKNLKNK